MSSRVDEARKVQGCRVFIQAGIWLFIKERVLGSTSAVQFKVRATLSKWTGMVFGLNPKPLKAHRVLGLG